MLSSIEKRVSSVENKQETCPARKREEGEEMKSKTVAREWSNRTMIGGFMIALIAAIPGWIALLTGCSVSQDDEAGNRPNVTFPDARQKLTQMVDFSRTWAVRSHGAVTNDPDGDSSTGDSLLFDGLLCFAGEAASCEAVRRSQDAGGQFWRSPEWVGREYGSGSTFSRDMSLGALAGILGTGDKPMAELWGHYVKNHDYRLCPDEANCKLNNPIIWSTFRHVFDAVGAARFGIMWASEHGHEGLSLQAKGAPVGFQLHLTGVHVLLLQHVGIRKPTTSQILANRQPENPFFAYLNGETDRAIDLALRHCPASQPASRHLWMWEREIPHPRPDLQSGGWDCVFIGRLLLNSLGVQ